MIKPSQINVSQQSWKNVPPIKNLWLQYYDKNHTSD